MMKKIKKKKRNNAFRLRVTHEQLKAIFKATSLVIDRINKSEQSLEEQIVISTLQDFFSTDKIKSRLLFFEGEDAIDISQPLAMSLVWVIYQTDLLHDDYLGNYLFKISNEIHQFYNL